MTRRPALALAAALLLLPLSACDGGSVEPDGNDGEATPTAPPTDDDDTGEDTGGDDGDGTDDDGSDDDGRGGPDGSGDS